MTGPAIAAGLGLAATPTFAAMALATLFDGPSEMLCMGGHPPLLGGMAPMYLLMSAFHAGPWLKLVDERFRRQGADLRRDRAERSHSSRAAITRRVNSGP